MSLEHVGLDAEAVHGRLQPRVDLVARSGGAAHRYAPGRRWRRVWNSMGSGAGSGRGSRTGYPLPRLRRMLRDGRTARLCTARHAGRFRAAWTRASRRAGDRSAAAAPGGEALLAVARLAQRADGVGLQARGLVARQGFQLVAHLQRRCARRRPTLSLTETSTSPRFSQPAGAAPAEHADLRSRRAPCAPRCRRTAAQQDSGDRSGRGASASLLRKREHGACRPVWRCIARGTVHRTARLDCLRPRPACRRRRAPAPRRASARGPAASILAGRRPPPRSAPSGSSWSPPRPRSAGGHRLDLRPCAGRRSRPDGRSARCCRSCPAPRRRSRSRPAGCRMSVAWILRDFLRRRPALAAGELGDLALDLLHRLDGLVDLHRRRRHPRALAERVAGASCTRRRPSACPRAGSC